MTTGGTLAQDHTEELKNVILLDVAPTENVKIDNGVLAVSKTLNINSGTFGIASTRYDKATFEAVNGTLNINGGNFNSSAHVNFTLAGKTVNVLNNAVFSSSVSESGSSHPIYRIKGDNISFAGTAKSGRLQLYFIPYKDGGKWNISAPIEEYSVIFGEEESSGYVNPASMVEVSETIAATGMFKESPGSVKVNRGITVHFSKDVSSAHFFQNRGVVRLDGTLTTGFYGGFEDSALYGTGSIVMNVPDDGKSAHRALHNIGYNPTTGKTERFKSIVVKSQKNNSYGNYYITGQSSIETVTVIDSGINLMGRRSLIDIGTLTVSGYYDYSLSFGLFQVTDGAIANIGMLTVNETEAWVKIDSTLIVDKYKLPPKGSSTDGSFGAFLLQDGATFLRRNGGVLELDDFYQNGDVNIGGASTTTPATFGAGDWSKVYATGYVDLKGDGQNASKFYGIKGLSSDVASLVNAETGLNFIISSGAVEVKNIYGETGGKGVVKSGATLTADSVSLSINTSKIIAPTIQIDQDGRLNLQSSIEAFGGKNYVVFKGKGTLSVPKNIAEKLTETALYAFLDNLGTLEIDTSTGDNTVVLYDNRDNQDISSSIDKLVFKGDNAGTLQLCDKLIVRGADFGTNGKVHLITGSTLYFDVNGTLPANIIGTGTLGLLNSSKLELSDAAVGNLTLEGLEIDGKAEAVIKADISIDKLKFMQDTGGTLGIDSGKTLTVKSGVTMGTGNKIDGANGALIVQGDSSFSNTVLGTLTAQKATFKGGNSTIGTYNAQGDVVVEAGTTLAVVNAFDLSGGYHVSGDGSLTVGAGGKIATGDKVLANLTINGETTFYDDSTIGTLKVTDGVTAKVATDKTLTISKSFSGAINAGEGSKTTLRLIDSAQADFKAGDSTKMARFVMEGADARAAFYGNYSLNEMELKQGTIVLADGAVLSLSHGILSGGNITGGGTLNLTAQNTEITKTGNYALSHLTFGNGGALTLNGTLTMLNDTNVKGLSGSGTLNFGANGTVGGGKFDGTISVGQNKVTVESDMTLGTFKFTQSAGGTLWINDNVTLTVGKLQGVGSNTVRGGILKLLSGGEIGNINITGELSLGGDTTITGDSVIDTVTATGDVIIADGVTLTVNGALSAASVSGVGELTLTNGGSLTTGGKVLGTLSGGQATITGDSTVGALNADVIINAGKTLTITKSVKDGIAASGDGLLLLDGASAAFGSAAIKNLKLNNASVALSGVLTVDSLQAGDAPSALTGGTLALAGNAAFNGKMDVDALKVNAGTFTFNGTTGDVKKMTLADGAKLVIATGELNAYGFTGTNNTVTIAEDAAFGLDLGSSQALPTGLTITGAGYLSLLNETSLTFAGNAGEFGALGGLQVMRGTVTITEDTNVKNFRFGDKTGGALNIENGTFSVSKITTVGDGNKITGEGTLKLTNGDSVFGSAVNGTKIVVGEKATALFNGKTVLPTLTVESGGGVGAGENGDVSIAELSMKNGKIFGSGVLKADKLTMDGGTVKVSGGLAAKTIENGTLEVEENGVLSLENSVLNSAGITMTGGLLNLKTDYALSALNLTLNGGTVSFGTLTVDAAFVNAGGKLSGTKLIWAHDGELTAQADVDTLQINAGLVLTNDTTVNTLDFGGSGALTLSGGLTVNGSLNLTRDITGNGTLIAAGDAVLGANFGGTLQIGTDAKAGTATVVSDAAFGGLTFGGKGGAVEINAGKRLSVPTVSVASGGTVAGDGTLALTGTGSVLGANLSVAEIELSGQATAQTASVNGLTLKDGGRVDVENGLSVAKLKQTGTDGVINGGTLTVQSAAVKNSLTLNNAAATIGSLSGAGVLRLNGSDTVLSQANIGTLAVSGGTLNIGKNQITANAFTMENGTLKLQIGKNATDGNGNATGVGHGKITGGTTVSNSALSIEVEYNTYIPKNGVVFKLFDGSQNGAFAEVANEKYKITAESNGNYRIAKLHTSAENAGNAGGNKNQQNTAEGLLDHPPFDEGDKTYDLADELNRLEQSDKQSFLDGLTAAAPDVSGAVSAAHLRSQRVINSMTVKRLTALHDKLGRSSYGFRRDQKLMRGMRRGRSGGSRYYDARKYYQKAYGRGAARSSVRSKPYENYWSNGLAEYQNWRTPTASVWAETLLNKTTYKDDGKPDGFSGTSTGFTVGLDTVMMDIAAAGVGYAHTTTDITALNRKTTFTSNTLFVYGTFKPNETYLSAIVNFGAGSYDEDKTVGTLKLSDAYDAKQYGVQITAGGNFDVYNPSVGLRYSAANLDAREDSAGQKVAAQSFKTLTLSVDNRWELPLKQTKWTKTGMNLNVGAAYDISRSADKAEVALSNGASYTVEGANPDALTFNAGAEVYWIFGRKISLSAKYDADIASSYLSHSVSANLSFQF